MSDKYIFNNQPYLSFTLNIYWKPQLKPKKAYKYKSISSRIFTKFSCSHAYNFFVLIDLSVGGFFCKWIFPHDLQQPWRWYLEVTTRLANKPPFFTSRDLHSFLVKTFHAYRLIRVKPFLDHKSYGAYKTQNCRVITEDESIKWRSPESTNRGFCQNNAENLHNAITGIQNKFDKDLYFLRE